MKKRIAFLSRFLSFHSVGHTTNGLITALDRDKFEVLLIMPQNTKDDEMLKSLSRSVDAVIKIPEDIITAAKLVKQLNLDLLVYCDIGMDPLTYFLAHYRLAPSQAVMAGHPDTTGIPAIDYFLSYKLLEDEDNQKFYTEKLVLLDGIPSVYEKPILPDPVIPREELDLPEEFIFLPAKLQKIHPNMDYPIQKILNIDSSVKLVLIRDANRPWHRYLDERLKKTLGSQYEQIVWHDWFHQRPEYYSAIYHSLFVLDSFPFGGGNTNYQVFGVGKCMVTLPNKFMRSRNALMLLKFMDESMFDCLIAKDVEDYANKAIDLLTSPACRGRLETEIRRKNGWIFNNHTVVKSFEEWAWEVTEGEENDKHQVD